MKILLTLFLFVTSEVSAQEIENFSASKPKSIEEIRSFEDSLGAISEGYHSFQPYFDERFEDMIPNVKPKALIFERADSEFFPALHTWYFFDSDSLVRGFYCNWGFYNPSFNPSENKEILEQQNNRKDDYIAHYEEVLHKLEGMIGKPTKEEAIQRSRKKVVRMAIWDKENYRTVLELNFDPSLKTLPGTDFFVGGESHVKVITFYK